jgi:hypothetical protein
MRAVFETLGVRMWWRSRLLVDPYNLVRATF